MPSRDLVVLSDLPRGASAIIREVSDADSSRLRRLASDGFLLGTVLEVLAASEDGDMVVRVGNAGQSERTIDRATALVIRVERTN
jgi:hypothetical protein